jgi:hypothetical protein
LENVVSAATSAPSRRSRWRRQKSDNSTQTIAIVGGVAAVALLVLGAMIYANTGSRGLEKAAEDLSSPHASDKAKKAGNADKAKKDSKKHQDPKSNFAQPKARPGATVSRPAVTGTAPRGTQDPASRFNSAIAPAIGVPPPNVESPVPHAPLQVPWQEGRGPGDVAAPVNPPAADPPVRVDPSPRPKPPDPPAHPHDDIGPPDDTIGLPPKEG